MEADRRSFLKFTGAILLPAPAAAWWEARRLVRGGGIGRVVFCRASAESAGWLPFLLDGGSPVCEASAVDELVICGSEATLVVDRDGYRRFA